MILKIKRMIEKMKKILFVIMILALSLNVFADTETITPTITATITQTATATITPVMENLGRQAGTWTVINIDNVPSGIGQEVIWSDKCYLAGITVYETTCSALGDTISIWRSCR